MHAVHVDEDLLPGLVVPDGNGARALGAGPGDVALAAPAVTGGAGAAEGADVSAGGRGKLLIVHGESLQEGPGLVMGPGPLARGCGYSE